MSVRRRRILIGRLFHESHSFNPRPTDAASFRVQCGPALIASLGRSSSILAGIARRLAGAVSDDSQVLYLSGGRIFGQIKKDQTLAVAMEVIGPEFAARQVQVLEGWIDEAAASANPFIVLGDFNRRFNQQGDVVWADLDDGEPANADPTAITEKMPISCRDNAFPKFIDRIVFDRRTIGFVDRSSFRHVTYRRADKEIWDQISDHCPVVVEMWIQ